MAKVQETLTLLSTLPTLCSTPVATSAMPARRDFSTSWRWSDSDSAPGDYLHLANGLGTVVQVCRQEPLEVRFRAGRNQVAQHPSDDVLLGIAQDALSCSIQEKETSFLIESANQVIGILHQVAEAPLQFSNNNHTANTLG